MRLQSFVSRRSLSLALLSVALEWGVGSPVSRGATMPRPPADTIVIRLHNYAAVPKQVLERTQAEAGRVFGQMGVEFHWVDCPTSRTNLGPYAGCLQTRGLNTIDLNLLPRRMAELANQSDRTLGLTPISKEGELVTITAVFVDLVKERASRGLASVSQLLACAIAHEIGHILLRTSGHSTTGIMRGFWTPKDLQQIAQGYLLFTPQEAQSIQKNLTKLAWTNLFGSANPTPAKATETNLKINVCVYNLASVPWGTLAQAEKEARRIFERTGVQLSWLNYPLGGHEVVESSQACGPPFGAADVRLRLLTQRLTELRETHPHSLGLALPCVEADGGCFVNVFYQRTLELAKDADLGLAKVLGHAIAHEIGHLLLGSKAHSPVGLMRAKWGPEDLHRAERGDLLFRTEEATIIRAQVVARMRHMP